MTAFTFRFVEGNAESVTTVPSFRSIISWSESASIRANRIVVGRDWRSRATALGTIRGNKEAKSSTRLIVVVVVVVVEQKSRF
jgi:hypothetical protein